VPHSLQFHRKEWGIELSETVSVRIVYSLYGESAVQRPSTIRKQLILTGCAAFFVCLSAFPQQKADRIVIEKSHHRMTLFAGPKILRIYHVWLSQSPVGAKQQEGDLKTPEGDYIIDGHNKNSAAHRSLHISYPNQQDQARATAAHVKPGGNIMIHGVPNGAHVSGPSYLIADWTYGCFAVTDKEIEEIYDLVPNGARVHIEP
jgi:murein L,D-transpeptidase YafK